MEVLQDMVDLTGGGYAGHVGVFLIGVGAAAVILNLSFFLSLDLNHDMDLSRLIGSERFR